MRPFLALAAFVLLALPASRADAQSLNPAFRAFVWADEPSAASYTPDAGYRYNPAGAVTITRASPGSYTVRFAGLASVVFAANVQVTPYATTARCRANGVSVDGSDLRVSVRCDDAGGTGQDAQYSLLLTAAPAGTPGVGYTWNSSEASSSTPSNFTYNASGGTTTITRTATGRYTVLFAGLAPAGGGTVQVTAFDNLSSGLTVPGTACQSTLWTVTTSVSIDVLCQNSVGPVDARFYVLFLPSGQPTPGLAFAWAGQPTDASYTPPPAYSYNAGGGAITASRSGTGVYNMTFSGLAAPGGNVQITAFTPDRRCYTIGWSSSAVNVACVDAAGAAADAAYNVLFVNADVETATEGGPEAGGLALEAAVPTPALGWATLGFTLPEAADVRLAVYDALGREVAVLVTGAYAAGRHTATLDAGALAPGVYVARLTAGGAAATRRVVVTR